MKKKKHFTIPFFITHKGCPNRCIFCDQNRITGENDILPEDIGHRIEEYLSTITSEGAVIEAGFFGGTFTGLDPVIQESFLRPVQKYIKEGKLSGIRLSTRPDYINVEILSMLKRYNVTCVELGVQSMSEKVLRLSARGYSPFDVERASEDILTAGFDLGHQMMVGLPGSAPDDEYLTAKKAFCLGASQVRIYPVLVMKDTVLSEMWKKGEYSTLTETEAVERCMKIIIYCNLHDIKVLRCGLHPSDSLVDGTGYLSGPFHPAFRQKVESRIFYYMLSYISEKMTGDIKSIGFNPSDEAFLFGFNGVNSPVMKRISGGGKGIFRSDESVPRASVKVYRGDGVYDINVDSIASKVLPGILL